MKLCSHTQVGVHFRITKNHETGFFACLMVECAECLVTFEFDEALQLSVDMRQILVPIRPAQALIHKGSGLTH